MSMHRRAFLKTLIVSAAGTLAARCSDDDGAPGADTGLDGSGDTGTDTDTPLEVVDGSALFAQSVASGDPRPTSVILWTRIVDGDAAADTPLFVEVARDEAFGDLLPLDGDSQRALTAEARFDHCVKVRVTNLEPGTAYFYRFSVVRDGQRLVSRTGRTRTAPAEDADVPVRFAFVSCQDFSGRYYNSYARLAQEQLDFVIHLGDYIYETTSDPTFQTSMPDRVVAFDDRAGAITLNPGTDTEFQAAASLDNYRQLYRIYRTDPDLQRMHEAAPFVVIWDDHEFSDDCHGATATFFDGRRDELDMVRRMHANQAWYEYQPVDYEPDPAFIYDPGASWPDDLRIYRRFRFGRHVDLVLTDLRTYRSDHVVPEDAYPGQVVVTAERLARDVAGTPSFACRYADIDVWAGGRFSTWLRTLATEADYPADRVSGLISVDYLLGRLEAATAAGRTDLPDAPTDEELAGLPLGLAWHTVGKSGLYGQIGARYLARKEPFRLLARILFEDGVAPQQAMGDAQQAWFLDAIRSSQATWRVWGTSFTLMSRAVDVSNFAVPEDFKQKFLLSVEDWDGMPDRRRQIVDALAGVPNVVAVTGDIHAFFAGTTSSSGGTSGISEYVGAAISSGTYKSLLLKTAASDPDLVDAGAPALALLVESLLVAPETRPNPHLAHADIDRNGFSVAEVGAASFDVTFYAIDERAVSRRLPEAELATAFEAIRFQTRAGIVGVWREFEGTWKLWNPTTFAWEA